MKQHFSDKHPAGSDTCKLNQFCRANPNTWWFYNHFRLIPNSCKASDRTKVDFTMLVRIGNLKKPFFFTGKQNKQTNKNNDIQKTYLLNRRMYYMYFKPTNLCFVVHYNTGSKCPHCTIINQSVFKPNT